ncbi:hypothetical protein BJY04DRAFT_219130 [Aspergillus karnatakaensis]|uniref:uncharacterized protein n=1 Tax=Aspergillus karnatakaensis TaxID=1810916 RepID=UPI003CCCD4DE
MAPFAPSFAALLMLLATKAYSLEPPGNHGEVIIDGYKIVELQTEVAWKIGEDPIILNGTVQDVRTQLLELNPNYELEAEELAKASLISREEQHLQKRDNTFCGRWPYADLIEARDNVRTLRGQSGRPSLGAGPGVCARVACTNDGGAVVWWCNDNTYPVTLGSFNNIADAATVIEQDCAQYYLGAWILRGQRFHDDNINVIVRSESGSVLPESCRGIFG